MTTQRIFGTLLQNVEHTRKSTPHPLTKKSDRNLELPMIVGILYSITKKREKPHSTQNCRVYGTSTRLLKDY
jgi:hypothetical protein